MKESKAVEVLRKVVTDIDYIGACKKKSRFAYQTNMKELSKAIYEALLALEKQEEYKERVFELEENLILLKEKLKELEK